MREFNIILLGLIFYHMINLRKMTGKNPIDNDLVNINVFIKFGQILSICSKGIEQKQNSDINQGP